MVCKLVIIAIFLAGCASVRPWTNEEKVLLGVSCLAMAADMTTTVNMLDNGNGELNPIMGKHPSNVVAISVMALTQVVTVMVAHYWGPWRSTILGIKTGINTALAFHNTRIN